MKYCDIPRKNQWSAELDCLKSYIMLPNKWEEKMVYLNILLRIWNLPISVLNFPSSSFTCGDVEKWKKTILSFALSHWLWMGRERGFCSKECVLTFQSSRVRFPGLTWGSPQLSIIPAPENLTPFHGILTYTHIHRHTHG